MNETGLALPGAGMDMDIDMGMGMGMPMDVGVEDDLTPPQKAAIIISALLPDDAGNLLQKLGQPHIRAYVTATRQLRHIPITTLERVVAEFLASLDSKDITIRPDTVEHVLSRIMSPEAVSAMLGEELGAVIPIWKRVQDVPALAIATYIKSEHPRIASVVMGRLGAEKAAEVIDVLDAESAEIVVEMLKSNTEVRAEVLEAVEESILNDLLGPYGKKRDTPDVFVGAVFDNLTEQSREPLMKSLNEKAPEFADAVAKNMFLFDDIAERMNSRDVPALMTVVDQVMLTKAVAYAASRKSPTGEFILSYMPKRMAEQIREAMEEMGEIDKTEGEEAEGKVIRSVRSLASAGKIKLKPS